MNDEMPEDPFPKQEYEHVDHDPRVSCPICLRHTVREALESEAAVLTGVEAFLNKDGDTLEMLQSTLTEYDAHTAISMFAALLNAFAIAFGSDPMVFVHGEREQLNASIAALDEEAS